MERNYRNSKHMEKEMEDGEEKKDKIKQNKAK